GGGLAPHRHIDVLQHVLGLASVSQDTEADAEKLRRGILVYDAQGVPVARSDAHKSGGQLAAICICAHPSCRPAAVPSKTGRWPHGTIGRNMSHIRSRLSSQRTSNGLGLAGRLATWAHARSTRPRYGDRLHHAPHRVLADLAPHVASDAG